jgi:putative peptidoglycan binding protein
MKKGFFLAVAVIATFVLLQSAQAGSRGASRSFSSGPHFSAPRFSAPAAHYSAPSRSFSSNGARFSSHARFSAAPRFHNRAYTQTGPHMSSVTALRNNTYMDRARFSADRTAAFNSPVRSSSTARLTPGNRTVARSQAFNQGRVVARHSANWRRNWDRGRDHWWRGHRCHFRNGFWFVYDPFPFYSYYGLYPYGGYYSATYYDDGYGADYDQQPAYTDQQQEYTDQGNDPGDSQVSNVQSALAREGYYDGAIDGTVGPATRKALRRFQRDHGLDATGTINRGVLDALRLR